MSEESANPRRVLFGIIGAIVLIGVIGFAISRSVDDEPEGGTSVVEPGANVDKFSAEGICAADAVVRFDVETSAKSGSFTATAAVEKWLGANETARSTNIDEDTKRVGLAEPGKQPRVVLTVKRTDNLWRVTETAACLEKATGRSPLAFFELGTKRLGPQDGDVKAGALVGQAEIDRLTSEAGGSFISRGRVAPISVFEATGRPVDYAIVRDHKPVLLSRVVQRG
ncbi:hypothetical protein ABIE44_002321 [Marmoricola sp. OAE513]|uniref:hypothetical protein n=1 Tax=Marmoricola sp. OAE513 TaxID=2817894 RepID=UPI001AEADD1C